MSLILLFASYIPIRHLSGDVFREVIEAKIISTEVERKGRIIKLLTWRTEIKSLTTAIP